MARRRPIPNDDIILLTTTVFGIPASALHGRTKDRAIVRCRQVTMHLCHVHGDERRTKQLGALFGQTTTAAHGGFSAIVEHMEKDANLANRVACLHGLILEGPEALAERLAPYRNKSVFNFGVAAGAAIDLGVV